MLTDWLIVRRLAAELDRTLRGRRITAAGKHVDGRFALIVAKSLLAIDAFGPTQVLTLEAEAPLEKEAGWVRTFADALVGLRVDSIRARRGDRLIALECSSRSRFGVASGYRLVAELVPRFGNIVLLKDDTVVAAAKEFPRSASLARTTGGARATVVGEVYEPPPLPGAGVDAPLLEIAISALAEDSSDAARSRASRSLRAAVPLVPRLVAESLVFEAMTFASTSPRAAAERAITRASDLVASAAGDTIGFGDVFTYRERGELVQCHVVPLAQYAALDQGRVPELVPLLAEVVGLATRVRTSRAFENRRATLRARVTKRRDAFDRERTSLERERDDAAARDALRTMGDLLYAHLDEIPRDATTFVPPSAPEITIPLDPALDAKGNAAAIFKRYRKATAKLDRVEKRLPELDAERRFADELAWELERAEPETIDDVAELVERYERRRTNAPKEKVRKRKPLDVRIADDARIYVGRTPRGNAELTFRIARPDDLWFHARATPGAHVVLQVDTQRDATPEELTRAASLAAFHSKARASEKVSVDYTERKHVRRQQNAPPGLVWYTHARTMLVAPIEGPIG